jgi:hypothetical protein
MSFDPAGEWGLRYRLRLANRGGYTPAEIAAVTGVAEAVVAQYLTDSNFVPDPADAALMVAGLPALVPPNVFEHHTDVPGGIRIWYQEVPLWTDGLLDGVAAPPGAERFKINYLADSLQHRIRSSRVYFLDEFDPAEVARDATGYDLSRLVSIVYYGPQ